MRQKVLLVCVLLALGMSSEIAHAVNATTYLGGGVPALAPINTLNNPTGVAVDDGGNVLVADKLNHRIVMITPAGQVSVVAGTGVPSVFPSAANGDGGPATAATLNKPFDVEVVGNCTIGTCSIYIADTGNNRIRKVSGGIITTVAGTGVASVSSTAPNGDGGAATAATLNAPKGLAVDQAGNIYIADSLNHRVRRVDIAGKIWTVAGLGVAGFGGDTGPAVAAKLNHPRDVAVDANGNIYISDQFNHRIRKVFPDGTIITFAGNGIAGLFGNGGDATLAQLNKPAGIDVDADGRVYVADLGNHQIRMIDPNDVIIALMGTGIGAYGGDGGPSKQASLWDPNDVVDAASGVFIADRVNNRVRHIGPGDTDWDDVLDILDAFPLDPAASVDGDKDGAPDAWNPNASFTQIGASPLILDQFPTDPTRQTTGWTPPVGVNLAGGEFAPTVIPGQYGVDYAYPNAAELDYYLSKGFTTFRLPILWERLQPNPNQALKATELARIDAVLAKAAARNMKVILDLHNFGRYRGAVMNSAMFSDFWNRLALHFTKKPSPALYGYGIMNEPHGPWPGVVTWQSLAQAAVHAIRVHDKIHPIIIAGDAWGSAKDWEIHNANLNVVDVPPSDNLIFEAHQYFDADSSGKYMAGTLKYMQTYSSAHGTRSFQDVIGERLYAFVGWLKKYGRRGILSEFGVPAGQLTDPAWLNLLPPLIRYLDRENVGWMYWAGGPIWGTDPQRPNEPTSKLVIEPINGADRPQMRALLPLMDTDRDGVTNDVDAFPTDPAASVDSDGDGFPDAWNANATPAQIAASPLVLDDFPNDPTRGHVPPNAVPDVATTLQGQAVTIDVLANDSDPLPTDPIFLQTFEAISANGGTVTRNPNATLTYTPATGFSGTDSFLYTISDQAGYTATASVTVTVTAVAAPPPPPPPPPPPAGGGGAPAPAGPALDSDGDGVPDSLDAFPNDPAASVDTDGDGAPDAWNANATPAQIAASPLQLDVFPNDPAASIDSDGDGFPDAWNANATQAQIAASPLRVDAFPRDPAASVDTDGDGAPDAWNANATPAQIAASALKLDAFPNDPAASVDTDGDGHPDAWNANATPAQIAASLLTLDAFPNDPTRWVKIYTLTTTINLGDLDGDGFDELATLKEDRRGYQKVYVRNSKTRKLIRVINFGRTYTPVDLRRVDDLNGNRKPELALLGVHRNNGRVLVQVRDGFTGRKVRNITLQSAYEPKKLAVIPGQPVLLAVLGVRADGSVAVQLHQARTGRQVRTINYGRNYRPVDFGIVPSKTPGLAVLAVHRSKGFPAVLVRSTANGKVVKNLVFSRSIDPRILVVESAAQCGVVGVHLQSGRVIMARKHFRTGRTLPSLYFRKQYTPVQAVLAGNLGGGKSVDVALLGVQQKNGRVTVQVVDSGSRRTVATLRYNATYQPDALVVVKDLNGNGSAEVGVLGTRRSKVSRIELRDGRKGALVSVLPVP